MLGYVYFMTALLPVDCLFCYFVISRCKYFAINKKTISDNIYIIDGLFDKMPTILILRYGGSSCTCNILETFIIYSILWWEKILNILTISMKLYTELEIIFISLLLNAIFLPQIHTFRTLTFL